MSNSRPQTLAGLSCPVCGGEVQAAEGAPHVACRHCGSTLAVRGARGVPRYMVLDTVERGAAEAALRRWWSSGFNKHGSLVTEATIEESFLAFFPFVRVRFDLLGALFGIVKQQRNKRTIEVPREITIERSFDLTAPAAETAEFGVGHCDLTADTLWPVDEARLAQRGMVFRPQHTPEEVATKMVHTAIETVAREARLDRVLFQSLESARRRVSLIQYPFWVFRYSFRGRLYQALIDAQDGRLWVGKAPGNDAYRASCLIAGIAGAAFVSTSTLQALAYGHADDDSWVLLVLAGAAGLAMLGWGFRVFRRGGLVEEGQGLSSAPVSSGSQFLSELKRRAGLR